MAFWDPKHGVVLGDPIPDESGKLKFEVLLTDDGQTWHAVRSSQLPDAIEGEGAFAASNSCLAILHSRPVILSGAVAQAKREQVRSRRIPTFSTSFATTQGILSDAPDAGGTVEERRFSAASARQNDGASAPADPNIWFATGGKIARVFHSPDRGQTWQVFNTPILHGPESAGIFSIAFRDAQHGVIAGGDYKRSKDDGPNLAFTSDGGKTWTLSDITPQAYFSAVAYDRRVNDAARQQEAEQAAAEAKGKKLRAQPIAPERLFIIGQDFIFDLRPPTNPRRLSGNKKLPLAFNAVSSYPEGGALIVGPKGAIVFYP
jgi:photosystem II stability/assembly factor-like uncharacterized protein